MIYWSGIYSAEFSGWTWRPTRSLTAVGLSPIQTTCGTNQDSLLISSQVDYPELPGLHIGLNGSAGNEWNKIILKGCKYPTHPLTRKGVGYWAEAKKKDRRLKMRKEPLDAWSAQWGYKFGKQLCQQIRILAKHKNNSIFSLICYEPRYPPTLVYLLYIKALWSFFTCKRR